MGIRLWGLFWGGCLSLTLLFNVQKLNAKGQEVPFYRILHGGYPGVEQHSINEFLYGAKIVYTQDVDPGKGPKYLNGIVWHATQEEALFYLGTQGNPVLDHDALARKLWNKWAEARLIQEFYPEAYPKTFNLLEIMQRSNRSFDVANPQKYFEELESTLKDLMPQGFFLKPVEGFDSGGFPSDKSDFYKLYSDYQRYTQNDWNKFLSEVDNDPNVAHQKFRHRKSYLGKVMADLLKNPESVIVQERLNPALLNEDREFFGAASKKAPVEFRVHVVEGKILSRSTILRWGQKTKAQQSEIEKVEKFTREFLNRLPKSHAKLSFGIDIMKLVDGTYKIIELNAGGDSGYLHPDFGLLPSLELASKYSGTQPSFLKMIDEMEKASNAEELREIQRVLFENPAVMFLKKDFPSTYEELKRLIPARIFKIHCPQRLTRVLLKQGA